MKAKILFALTALLMLGSVSLNAQENGNSSNSESTTQLEGDLNHDNKVDVADVTYLVNIIMKNKDGGDSYFWYLSNIALTEDNVPHDIQAQDAQNHKGWRELDPNTTRLEIPYVEMDDHSQVNWYFATPASLGFNTIVNRSNIDVTGGFNKLPNVTVNGIEYDVWSMDDTSWRISGFYLVKSNNIPIEPTGTYWYLSNEALTENNTPHDIQAQDAEDHKGWRDLDPSTNVIEIPYVETDDDSRVNWCIAVPKSLGFNDIVSHGTTSSQLDGVRESEVTVNSVAYTVWTTIGLSKRISGFDIIKKINLIKYGKF